MQKVLNITLFELEKNEEEWKLIMHFKNNSEGINIVFFFLLKEKKKRKKRKERKVIF